MLFLFLITIFPFTPPFSCPHFWHTNNSSLSLSSVLWMTGCTAVAVKSPMWQAGAALHRGFWSSRWLSWWYFCSPLFHLYTSYNSSILFSTFFSPCHTPLLIPYEYSLKTNFLLRHPHPLLPLPFLFVAGYKRRQTDALYYQWSTGMCAVVEVMIRTAQLISVYWANEAWRSSTQLRISLIPSICMSPLKLSLSLACIT